MVELASSIHTDVDGIAAELSSLRSQLGDELDAVGLAGAAAGTHPRTLWQETVVSAASRYRGLGDSMRDLARREPTLALHVHIGIPVAEDATRALNGLRRSVRVLLALAANSSFWQGRDSGFSSTRTFIFQAFPRTGVPRLFEDYADYVATVDALIASGAVPDPSFLWWDVGLQPSLGTVEMRVMDAQSTVGEVAPLVALIQSLAGLDGDHSPPAHPDAGRADGHVPPARSRARSRRPGIGPPRPLAKECEPIYRPTERSGRCAAGSHTPDPRSS